MLRHRQKRTSILRMTILSIRTTRQITLTTERGRTTKAAERVVSIL